MNLQLLRDTPVVSAYYDTRNDWLFTDWRGELTLAKVKEGCLTIAQCFLERTYPRILNSNVDVTSISADVPHWLSEVYLPNLSLANIEYLAWVSAPSLLPKHLAAESVRELRAPTVATFDDLADAYAWLQHTRVMHPGDMIAYRTPEQQAKLNQRVATLTQELRHYEVVAGRASQ